MDKLFESINDQISKRAKVANSLGLEEDFNINFHNYR